MTTRRVALYARVSTNKGKADPNKQHTDNQLMQLRAYCERQGWAVVKEYIDEDSGRKAKRADFLQLFEDLPTADFDLVLFWALDRFSREGVRPTLNYLQRLDNAGIGYKSMTEEYFDSAGMFKDAIISIVATLANQEAVRHVERVNAGLDRARAKGTKLGRKALPEAKRELIKKLRAEGLSIRAIANKSKVSVGKVSEITKTI